MGRKRMQGLSVRTFNEGDEASIVELFNRVHQDYGGFVPRTIEYWRWCCLERPDVDKKGIFLVCNDDGALLGYLVAGSSGNIWEFCVSDDNREASAILLDEATKYLDKIGVSEIGLNVPSSPGIVSALRDKGFDQAAGAGLFVTTLNPSALLQALIVPWENIVAKESNVKLAVRLRNTPYGVSEVFSVKVENNSVTVASSLQGENSIAIEAEFMDLLSVLLAESSMTQMFLKGKIRVKPFWKFPVVLKLFQTIRLRDPWFFPLADLV